MFAFFTPSPVYGFGEASMGMTAGNGKEGAGDADRRIDIPGDAGPKDDLLLWLITLGGFIGSANDVGVPGHEGAGDPILLAINSAGNCDLSPKSGGAGLFDDIFRPGKSILEFMPILFGWSPSLFSRVNCPSFVLRVYMCTDRSEDCVAMYSFRGSHVTP